jgi:hypothetical protein
MVLGCTSWNAKNPSKSFCKLFLLVHLFLIIDGVQEKVCKVFDQVILLCKLEINHCYNLKKLNIWLDLLK